MTEDPLESLIMTPEDKYAYLLYGLNTKPKKVIDSQYKQAYDKGFQTGKIAGKRSVVEARSKIRRESNEKYARWFADTNRWRIPKGVVKPGTIKYDPSGQYNEERAFTYGMWYVLNELKRDGHISEKTINKYWPKK